METRCRHMGYSFQLTARDLLYAPSHRQDSTYHDLCYSSREALAETRNRSMGPRHERSIRRPIAPWANALTTELHLAPEWGGRQGQKMYFKCHSGLEPFHGLIFLISSKGSFMYRQDSTHHSLCYTCREALSGTRTSSVGPPWRIQRLIAPVMVDPLSYNSFQPVLHDWCSKGCGMCYPVCGMVHIKEPLLIIGVCAHDKGVL